jgi:hypothetical protein
MQRDKIKEEIETQRKRETYTHGHINRQNHCKRGDREKREIQREKKILRFKFPRLQSLGLNPLGYTTTVKYGANGITLMIYRNT